MQIATGSGGPGGAAGVEARGGEEGLGEELPNAPHRPGRTPGAGPAAVIVLGRHRAAISANVATTDTGIVASAAAEVQKAGKVIVA